MQQIEHRIVALTDKIFLLEIPNDFDRGMTFLRGQEFYESGSVEFKGKSFDIWDYMRWYSTERRGSIGAFTYTVDWAGYNLPGKVIADCYRLTESMNEELTPYDKFLIEVTDQIQAEYGKSLEEIYLIGAGVNSQKVISHEICHGLWNTDPEFKAEAIAYLKSVPTEKLEKAKATLIRMGYHEDVIDDEIFAYSATGDINRLFKDADMSEYSSGFESIFENYCPVLDKTA